MLHKRRESQNILQGGYNNSTHSHNAIETKDKKQSGCQLIKGKTPLDLKETEDDRNEKSQ